MFSTQPHSANIKLTSAFASSALERFNEDRKNGKFCDGRLQVGNVEFFVHRCVLCTASEEFERLFEVNGKASNRITLTGMREEDIATILEAVYTRKLKIKDSNAKECLIIADYLKLEDIRTACLAFLQQIIHKENSILYRNFGVNNNIPELVEKAYAVQLQHLSYVLTQPWFLDYAVNELKDFIEVRKKVQSVSEEEIFKAILSWFKHDTAGREKHLDEVFVLIKFNLVSLDYLQKLADSEDLFWKSPMATIKTVLCILFVQRELDSSQSSPLMNVDTLNGSSQQEQSTTTTTTSTLFSFGRNTFPSTGGGSRGVATGVSRSVNFQLPPNVVEKK